MGSEVGRQKVTATVWPPTKHEKAPPERGFSLERLKGFEPSTFCMASPLASWEAVAESDDLQRFYIKGSARARVK
jgi:hypothetical protein